MSGFGGKQNKAVIIGSYYMLSIIGGKTTIPLNAIVGIKKTKELRLYVNGKEKPISKEQFIKTYESIKDSKNVPENITHSLSIVQSNIETFIRRL